MKLTVFLVALLLRPLAAETVAGQMFMKAVSENDLNTLDNLVSSGFNPNSPINGRTPLFVAMQAGRMDVVDLLLAAHADPNAAVFTGIPAGPGNSTSLQYAVEEGNERLMYKLIHAGARINAQASNGSTALHAAASETRLDAIRILIQNGADVNIRDAEGASALDIAIWRASIDSVAILLAHGARLNEPDSGTGATPINEAVFRGDNAVVQYLLQFHPDLGIPDKRGYYPLDHAIQKGNEDAARLLLEAEPKERQTPEFLAKAMEGASRKDESAVVALLIQHGAALNHFLPSGSTPLDLAASTGAPKVVRVLLEAGADPNKISQNGATPLEEASLRGFESVVRLLLNHGASLDQVNSDSGTTALYAAASFGKTGVVKVLLDAGASPNLCGANRRSPYQVALANGYAEVAKLIQAHGGGVSCQP